MLVSILPMFTSGILSLAVIFSAYAQVSTITWKTAAPAPISRFEAQGVAVNGKLYVLGGFVNTSLQATKKCHVYDPAANTWKRIADMPEPITHSGAAVDGNFIYLAGGFIGNHPGPVTNHVWRYDISKNQWSAFKSLPKARGSGMIVRLGRQLHFFGGTIREGYTYKKDPAEHWAISLDAANPQWVSKAPLPNPRNHLGGVALNGKIYAIGGQHLGRERDGNQKSVHVYNPATNKWTALANMPRPLGHITASVFTLNNRIVVVGGVTTGQVKVANIIEYNPATNTWKERTPLPSGRQSPVADVIDGKIVVNGGFYNGVHATTWMGSMKAPDIEANKELIFSGVKGTTSAAQKVIVKNTGASSLTINSFTVKGTHASAFKVVNSPSTPLSIAAGQSKTIQLTFAPGSLTGVLSAVLQLNSNDPDEGKKEVGLYGLSAKGEQGSNEPTLNQIVKTLGYNIKVGGTNLILGTSATPIGDEVLVPLFQKAGSGTVTIKPVARYSPDDLLPFGYYTLKDSKPVHHQVAVVNVGQEQNLNPAIVSGGKTKFDPGQASFGFYVSKTSYAKYNIYTQDKLNMGPTKHAARVYPLKNRNGQSIANSYLIAFEPASNGDYQDYVFVVENVKPANLSAPSNALITNLSVSSGKSYEITSLSTQKTYYTDRNYVITSLPEYLKGAAAIKTANDDKAHTSTALVSFTLTKAATVYVAYDPRSSVLPLWLKGWTKSSGKMGVTDIGTSYLELYSKKYPSGKVTLGGNMANPAAGAKTNYIIAALEQESENAMEVAATFYEAEDAYLSGVVTAANHKGYSGSGFVDYVNFYKDYIQWTVSAEKAGEIILSIRYANGDAAHRPMQLVVNGKTVNSNVSFPPTGSWNQWATVHIHASLLAGKNSVKLLANGSGGANVDYLSVDYPNHLRVDKKVEKGAKEKMEEVSETEVTVQIYPNPASSELNIEYPSPIAQEILITLTDAYARTIKDIPVWVQQGENQIKLITSDMLNGLYVVSIGTTNYKISKKIIIAR